jgi:hypothetical protein
MTVYAFATKTVFDPSKGLSIKAFNSKTDYLRAAPLKLVSLACRDPNSLGTVMASLMGDEGAKQTVRQFNERLKPDDVLVSHTEFHQAALEIRSGESLVPKVVLVDELARQHNPALKSVSLDKLHALYGPHDLSRPKLDLIEGQHGALDIQMLNEIDAAIMLHLYETITGQIKQATAAAN